MGGGTVLILHSRAIVIIVNTFSKAVHVQFPTTTLVFTMIPIAREYSIILKGLIVSHGTAAMLLENVWYIENSVIRRPMMSVCY